MLLHRYMFWRRSRAVSYVLALVASIVSLAACASPFAGDPIVTDLLANPARFNGADVKVQGAFLNRFDAPNVSLLTPGVSTQDNGLDARPLGDPIWLENFPLEQIREQLHQPGDSVYGFVVVSGRFETGDTYGPNGVYKYQINVTKAEPIERIRRVEQRISGSPGDGKIGMVELADNPGAQNGKQVTTQGYYFWNGTVNVLAEGVSAEEDGSNPQPIGKIIWMEGFPPPVSGQLNVGPGSPPAYVWGKVEVTGQFQGGGSYGKDGTYNTFIQLDPNSPDAAKAIK